MALAGTQDKRQRLRVMNRTCISVFSAALVWVGAASVTCGAETISAMGECVDKQGLDLENVSDDQARFACLESVAVQKQCDMDGRLARLYAFQKWMKQLQTSRDQCEGQ